MAEGHSFLRSEVLLLMCAVHVLCWLSLLSCSPQPWPAQVSPVATELLLGSSFQATQLLRLIAGTNPFLALSFSVSKGYGSEGPGTPADRLTTELAVLAGLLCMEGVHLVGISVTGLTSQEKAVSASITTLHCTSPIQYFSVTKAKRRVTAEPHSEQDCTLHQDSASS